MGETQIFERQRHAMQWPTILPMHNFGLGLGGLRQGLLAHHRDIGMQGWVVLRNAVEHMPRDRHWRDLAAADLRC